MGCSCADAIPFFGLIPSMRAASPNFFLVRALTATPRNIVQISVDLELPDLILNCQEALPLNLKRSSLRMYLA
jgi:hypothetical protein